MDNEKDKLPQAGNEDTGRTHNSGTVTEQVSQKEASNDISAIDQQEGSMNRGEAGDADNSSTSAAGR